MASGHRSRTRGVSQGGRLHLERRKSFVPVCTFPQPNGLLCVAGGNPLS